MSPAYSLLGERLLADDRQPPRRLVGRRRRERVAEQAPGGVEAALEEGQAGERVDDVGEARRRAGPPPA